MNMLLLYLFASMKLEKGQKKLLGSNFKIMLPLYYEIGWNMIWNSGLNKKLNTIQWKRMCLVDLFCLGIIFTM